MAYTITRTSDTTVTVATDITNAATVRVYKSNTTYTLVEYLASTVVAVDSSLVITYSSDGIYLIRVVGVYDDDLGSDTKNYVDLCVSTLYDHIAEDVSAILNNEVDSCDYSGKRYDFIALTLLGLQYFGNTTYSLYVDALTWTVLPTTLQLIQDAINRSNAYVLLNTTTTQSSN